MKSVLFVSFIADAGWTGMGRWTYEIRAALEARGYRVDTWFADRFPRTRASNRFAVLVFPAVLAARLVRHRHDYDVVVLHEPCGFWYGLLRRIMPSLPPMIAMCHNVERHHYEIMRRYTKLGLAAMEPATRIRAPLMRHWQSNGTIRLADGVICLSTFDYQYITRVLKVPEERVTLVVNGIAKDAFADGRPAAGRQVIWVGGWLDVKGNRILPRLWNAVRQRLADAALILIGTGASADVVRADFPASDRESVTVYPRIERREQMRELYASGNAYLMSSLSEGSPLSLLEAMAAGLPAIATRVGGIPDIARDQVQALLFDPEQPDEGAKLVCRVLEDPALAKRLSAAGQSRARELSWEATGDQVARAIEKTLGRRS